MENFEEMINFIQEREKEGKVCFMTDDGIRVASISNFINQGAEGILYDLNRDKATTLTLAKENYPKSINDYAVAVVIEALVKEIELLNTPKKRNE